MPTRDGRENAAYLVGVFKKLWREAGETVESLPDAWHEQLVVWDSDGVTEVELRRFFRAWAAKTRTPTPLALWRYLQVCCFNFVHPTVNVSTGRDRRRFRSKDSSWRDDPWVEPPWMGRDPGPDVGW